ncbi:methionyl-tRNA formyltransferase [Candidatus Pantoea edessiphila]|uniref:Methionyl-tRNA formyltransferase n=1 Tax=Candidatus Pantoea edessiphila TaxID=2044610 RepID=A0A2P5SW12_9GAMM|nr:methionyl-tRNA formyltransferase [Candidatus Pantoea edessiphila]PPI86514.1 methionyl-tRNA formyltransferase [Candidatus Pantoea edessiphila]
MVIKLKIIFAGTSEFAVHHLNKIIQHNYQVVGVFTQPDRPSGRGQQLTPSPVKIISQIKNIPIFQPESFNDAKSKKYLQIIYDLNPDVMIVVSYGLLIPNNILKIPRLGCINVHASLLPRWRGAAPIQRAILAGDKKTGITIIKMNSKLDSGDILYQIDCNISSRDTSLTIYAKLATLGSQAVVHILYKLSCGSVYYKEQDNKLACYAKKINKKEAQLNWISSAEQLERCVRAFNPWPISFFYVNNNLIKVWQVSILDHVDKKPGEIIEVTKQGIQVTTLKGVLNLICLQPQGKKPMLARDFINSRYELFRPGTKLQ